MPRETATRLRAYTGSCSIRLSGATNHYAAFYSEVLTSGGLAGETFEVSAYVRGENVVAGPAAVGVEVLRTNGTKRRYWIGLPKTGSFDWQLFTKQFTTRLPYERIRVGVFFRPQGGLLWVDNMSFERTP